jgi:hypothetical protein
VDDGTPRIINHDIITLRERDFSGEGPFDLVVAPPRTCSEPDGLAYANLTAGCPGYLVSALLVGCWAYNDIALLAASDLRMVAPENISDPESMIRQDCADVDGGTCLLPNGDYGICFSGGCRRRCSDRRDCEPSGSSTMVETAGGAGGASSLVTLTCSHTCEKVQSTTVGACMEVP